ncbi:hypothetical protein Ping_1931 [Psychromonas ingrahamii 37]|uniref:Lipoprotein n=1 Tax=Psychromonas ingrahamii (strain DSM 17664 / CCUG 51855 / 37) TaxID=357804 RepID=A1SW37_PSYIN|nr:hypothetical protein [Psychromonas ingrahamii]ABM03702.1 hypothetical protein Ping_1931 [Psychromonas ingrahamii 37]
MRIVPMVSFAVLILSGCTSTPTGNIDAFGIAAADVTSKIDTVISDYNKANVNDKLVAMAQSNKKYVTSDMDPIKQIIIRDSDKKNFALYKANNALGGYAASLSDLANAGSREELALAGVKLSTSLKGMNEQYKSFKETESDLISDENSGKISRVITEISRYYVEYKRGEALKEIIIAADSSVQIIGNIINDQLLMGVIEGRLYTMKGNELAGYFSDYNTQTDELSFAKKKKMLDEIYEKYIAMESTTATVVQAQQAILSVMEAHSVLTEELKKNRFSSQNIAKSIKNIKTVHRSLDDLEELMKSCETKIISDDEKGIICQ